MAGIYIHIPFCRKFCTYCDFYHVKSVRDMPDYLDALEEEISIRHEYLGHEKIESLYFGGGTPSLLRIEQINRIYNVLLQHHTLTEGCEITLEANPDDLNISYLKQLKDHSPVNRLSIGIQSFSDDDLRLLGRRHDASQSFSCIENAIVTGFQNISIDMIYGLPGMELSSWERNLEYAFGMNVRHISAYHLTFEPGTKLHRMAAEGIFTTPTDEESHDQYTKLCEMAQKHEYLHYEVSNLCREGYLALHNTGYWKQKKYMGLGPSAHSYDIATRQWNMSDIGRYIRAMHMHEPVYKQESIDWKKRYNEYIMLSLRTQWGVNTEYIRKEFGESIADLFESESMAFLSSGHMVRCNGQYRLTEEAWFISDHIISRLLAD